MGFLGITVESIAVVILLIPPYFGIFIPYLSFVTAALMLVALLLLAASAAKERMYSRRLHGGICSISLVLLFMFFCFALINNNQSLAAGEGLLWMVQFGGALMAVSLLLICRSTKWCETALIAISLFGLFYSLATIFFWLFPDAYNNVYPYLQSKSSAIITGRGYRAGLTTHYSTNGIYLVLGFLASALLAFEGRMRKSWTIISAICLFALILSSKRAHLAFGFLSFTVAYFTYNSKRKLGTLSKFIVLISLLLLILYIVSFFNDGILVVIERFQMMEDDDSFGGREGFYRLCLGMWEESPLIGLGWGSYSLRFNQTLEGIRYASNGFSVMAAHNVYLQVLAEEGLIGASLFILSIASGLIITFRSILHLNKAVPSIGSIDSKENYRRRALLAGSFAVQLFFAMYCITGNPLYDAQVYIPWLLALGIMIAMSKGTS